MTHVLTRLFAACLVVLAALPFSAPFSTCNVEDLRPIQARNTPHDTNLNTLTGISHRLNASADDGLLIPKGAVFLARCVETGHVEPPPARTIEFVTGWIATACPIAILALRI